MAKKVQKTGLTAQLRVSRAAIKSCRALKNWQKSQQAKIEFGGTRIQGIVRTTDYISANRKMGFHCSEGQQWATTPANIIHGGTGCPRCARVVKKTNANIDAMALEDGRGYVCTTDFVNECKQQLCRQHGVTLIEIPYTVNPEE